MRFIKKAEEKIRRFEEVQKLLHDPEVTQDPSKTRELGKEFRGLERIAVLYRDYLRLQAEIEEARKILEDKDQPPDFSQMAAAEIDALQGKKKKTTHELESLLIQEDPMLSKNVILEIRAGTGGLEAGLFAGELFRMYSRFASAQGFKVECVDSRETFLRLR